MNLKKTVLLLVLAGSAWASQAADSAVSVVKILNFSCPVCRSSESLDDQIREAASRTGGKLVYAPLPSEEGTYARERIYYAARLQGTIAEARTRTALYRGAQDLDLPLSDTTQVVEWLKDELGATALDWVKLKADADAPSSKAALSRAAGVAVSAGAQALPSYVLVKDNTPVATLDPSNATKTGSLTSLSEDVVARISQLNKSTK